MRYPWRSVRFAKYEGLGNDFLIVEAATDLDSATVKALCDRHLGVGADGVLFVGAGPKPSMKVINADGSTAEMCGNGIRCVAIHLARDGGPRELTIATGAGPHRCRVLEDGRVEVEMRAAEVGPPDDPFPLEGLELRLTRVSMGNPHAVLFDEIGNAARLGPWLERDPRFPEGVNVGFAQVSGLEPAAIELAVWERGVGFTRACGTGACAAAAAAVATGRIPRGRPIDVRLPGGTLRIEIGELGAPVRMTGPARHVFDGTVDLAEIRA